MKRSLEDVISELENAKLAADYYEQEYNDKKKDLDPCSLATLGIHMCELIQDKLRLEWEQTKLEDWSAKSWSEPWREQEERERQLRHLNADYLSAGADMWEHVRTQVRLSDPTASMFVKRAEGSNNKGLAWSLMALYASTHPIPLPPQRGHDFRRYCDSHPRRKFPPEVLEYYNAKRTSRLRKRGWRKDAKLVWCHYPGGWVDPSTYTAMHIVPLNLIPHGDDVGELLCGRSDGPENRLIMPEHYELRYDANRLVIIPADPSNETGPVVKRWRIDDIYERFKRLKNPAGKHDTKEEMELRFNNENRPATSFLFLRFMLTLVAIKNERDTSLPGWENIWASYYQEKPFPDPPGAYVRTCFLRAICSYFGPTTLTTNDMKVIESYMVGESGGLGSVRLLPPLATTKHEEREVARRVHIALIRADRRWIGDPENDDPNSDYDSDSDHDKHDYYSCPERSEGADSDADAEFDFEPWAP
ncbi:hypothetical protein V8F33_002175 [Rhypophila sp. PSN 637]